MGQAPQPGARDEDRRRHQFGDRGQLASRSVPSQALVHMMTGLIEAFCVRDRDQAIAAPSPHQLMLGHDEMNLFEVNAIGHVCGGRERARG
jgi:hypothetical protein